jgi:parallel beta-helix repeat protein
MEKRNMRTICAAFLLGVSVISGGCLSHESPKTETTGKKPVIAEEQFDYMNLYKSKDSFWDSDNTPAPPKYSPPTDTGLQNVALLKESAPIKIEGDKALSEFPGIKGSGTKADPFILENLKFTVKDQDAISITKTNKHLIIRNMKFDGIPESLYSPSKFSGIKIGDSQNISIENCEVTKCKGIYIGGCKNISVSKCKVFSSIVGIFSSGGSDIKANYNWVEDAVKYGVFLYNGPNNEIGHNYVAWTGREGIGTHGTRCQNHYYHDNIVMHCGWTAINLEGITDNSRIENNFVKDTYYGIILMGKNVITRNNKVFYSGQNGMILFSSENVKNHQITDNLIVGSAQDGIWLMDKTSGHSVKNNRVFMSYIGINNHSTGTEISGNQIRRFFFGIQSYKSGTIIKNNQIYQGRNGMRLDNSENDVVEGNKFRYLCAGMYGKHISGTLIKNNSFTYVGQHLPISNGQKLNIIGNKFRHQAYMGIDLTDSSDNQITGNTFDNATTRSIRIIKGSGNVVKDNQISDVYAQFHGGAVLLNDTKNNQITGNKFKNCTVGIRFKGLGSEGNQIKDNSFEDSAKPIFFGLKKSDKELDKNDIDKVKKSNQISQ